MKPSKRIALQGADVLLTLLLTCATLCLFVETFALSVSPVVWIVTALFALFCPLAANNRGTARHLLLAAAVLTAAIGLLLTAETLPTSVRQLLDAIARRYDAVYQGQEILGIWWEDHTGAMTLLGLVLAGFLGFSLGGRRKRWLPAVLVTVALFALCIAVSSLPTFGSRVAMLGLLAGWLTLALTGTVRKSEPLRGALLSLLCLPLLAGSSAGVMAVMNPDAYTRPAWLEATLDKVEAQWDGLLINWGLKSPPEDTPNPGGVGGSVTEDGDFTWTDHLDGLDLSEVGPQRYTGKLIMKVRSNALGRMYLRGYSMGHYVDNVWLDPSLWVDTAASPLLYPGHLLETNQQVLSSIMEVELVNYSSKVTPVPYYAAASPSGWYSDTYLLRYTDIYSVPFYPYTGDFSEFTIGVTQKAAAQYTAEVRDYYTYVQPHVQDQLLAILAEEGITGGPDAIEQVAEFVKSRARYDLFTKPIPEDAGDFAVYFLTESRQGYCVHFATAATLLYRSLGIPARYVSGFTCNIAMANTWTPVADENAHAWVEVLVDGVGWMPVEVTPGMEPAAPTGTTTTGPEPSATTEPDSGNSTTDPVPSDTTTTVDTPEQPQVPGGRPISSTTVLAIALPLLLLAAVIVQWQWRVMRHRRQFADPDVNRSMVCIWKYARRLTRLGGRVSPDIKRLAEQAYFSEKGITKSRRDKAATEVTTAMNEAWKTMSFPCRLLAMFIFALK